jgi:hypothetical protein
MYGTQGNPRNTVESNVMWNCGDSGIQAAADAVIRNNIILESPNSQSFNSGDHNGVTPNNLEFVHNTIIGGNPCTRMSNWANKQGLVFANNAIYCNADNFSISGLTEVAVSGNVIMPSTPAFPSNGYTLGTSVLQDFVDAANRDVYPTSNSKVIDAADPAYATPFDFNGTLRSGQPDAGAYTWTGTNNPGWSVIPGFKQVTPASGPRPNAPVNLRVN